MPSSTAVVVTDSPARYAKQLVSHLGRKVPVEEEPGANGHRLAFDYGVGIITSGTDRLLLRAEAADPDALSRVEGVLARHLERFGQEAGLAVNWVRG
ncbi:MAG: DUF2218 domain-containing protein [Actinomycetes bacterium]